MISPLFIILIFILPFLTLISKIGLAGQIDPVDFIWAFKNTVFQSFFSSLFILIFGLWGSFGLFYFENPRRDFQNKRVPKATGIDSYFGNPRKNNYFSFSLLAEPFILLPNILPSLFIILSSLYIFSPFPFGRWGIILIHSLINIGLAAFTIKNLIKSKVGQMAELALIEGASFLQFFWYGILTYLKRDLFFIFLFFFAICFTSFQIPLVVGSTSGTTLEVLIYEKILIDNNPAQALSLTLIQSFCVFLLSYFAKTPASPVANNETQFLLLEKPIGIVFPVFATLILLVAPLKAIPQGLEQIMAIHFPFSELPWLLLQTLLIGLSTGLFIWIIGMSLGYYSDVKYLQKFFRSYLAPSPVIMGFFIYSVSFLFKMPAFLSLSLILSILWFSGLYRLYIAPALGSIQNQVQVAKTLGASPALIFTSVVLPQLAPSLGRAAALASLWAVGEFALSGFVASEAFHLAMVIKNLSSHYRLSAALLLSWILLAVGIICYFIFTGVSRVISRKSFL